MSKDMDIEILSISKYLPSKLVSPMEIDQKLNVEEGWSLKATGIKSRYFSDGETTAEMGAQALHDAVKNTDIALEDLDAIVSVSGTVQQLIPCTASLIAAQLGLHDGLATFDINATCLGFLVGLDLLACKISLGKYKTVALIASEIASEGLNWKQKESAALFGDGATAIIIGIGKKGSSKILASHFEAYPEGVKYCQIRGGSLLLHAKHYSEDNHEEYLFDMQGSKLFKLVMKKMPQFIEDLLSQINLTLKDIDLVIPHQASLSALILMRKRLGFSEEQFFINIQEQGNTISASIPMALHDAQKQGRVQRGDKILLIGSSAGVSLGGIILEY